MSVGTLLTVKHGVIIKRDPIWPYPYDETFPRKNSDGSLTYFERAPYYTFTIGAQYVPTHP